MRILFIAPFGSCHKQTLPRRMGPLAASMTARGHELLVLVPAWDCPQEAGTSWEKEGVRYVAPSLGPAPHPLADFLLYRRCWREAQAFAPDVVHVFKGLGYAGLLGYRLHRQGKPVFVDVDDLESVQGWGSKRPWPLRWWGRRQETYMLRGATGVSTASVVLKCMAGRWRSFSESILYLPNGVTRAASPTPVAANPPLVLLYTRGNDVDPRRVRAIWLEVLERYPEARLHIIGDWNSAPALPASIHLGWVKERELAGALRRGAVALFPVVDSALVRAKCPARVLDCLGHGLPIVTEDIGEYGLLAGPEQSTAAEDTGALIDDIVSLLRDPEERRRRGMISWRQAGGYAWDLLAAQCLDWYEGMLSTS